MSISTIKKQAFINALDLKLRRCRGDMLQKFLGELMVKFHQDNFEPATHYYSQGDLKCDGLIYDPLTVFACYGPTNGGAHISESALKKAVEKVDEDYEGALKHWPDLKHWVFVHNFVEGTPPQITHKIRAMQASAPNHTISLFGINQFSAHLLDLADDDIEQLIGNAATDADFRSIQIGQVQEVVDEIKSKMSDDLACDDQPVTVPADKLEFNRLPSVYRTRLNQGFQSAKAVAEHLETHPDPTLNASLASIFKSKYLDLKSQNLRPGQIMDELYEFALGGQRAVTAREVAVWGLLAHFFEKCTIFEDDPSKVAA